MRLKIKPLKKNKPPYITTIWLESISFSCLIDTGYCCIQSDKPPPPSHLCSSGSGSDEGKEKGDGLYQTVLYFTVISQ